MYYKSSTLDNFQLIVDAFADHFESVYNPSILVINPNNNLNLSTYDLLNNFQLSISDVECAIKSLKPTLTASLDNIPLFLLKDFAPFLSNFLCKLFNSFLMSGHFPDSWKLSKIVPVFKSGEINSN